MRRAVAIACAFSCLLMLNGCMGYQTGKGLNALDTVSKEEKEEDAWFKSFYGKDHCGVTVGWCDPAAGSGVGASPWGGDSTE